MANTISITTIDLQSIYNPANNIDATSNEDSYKQIAGQIREIYSQIGFCYLINHNISHELIDQVFAMSKAFFELPQQTKMLIKQDHGFRGYIPLNSATTKESTLGQYTTLPNHNEAFIMAESKQIVSYSGKFPKFDFLGANKWLEDETLFAQCRLFRATLLQYYSAMQELVQTMFKIFAYAFDIELSELMSYFQQPTQVLRFTNYPPIHNNNLLNKDNQKQNVQQFGFAPHTDMGFFALLQQDSVGGLEVQNQDGIWSTVTPIPYAFVLNTSDTMKFMTNNKIIATPHRVICRDQPRKSIALFVDPTLDKEINVLSSFQDQSDLQSSNKSFIYSDYMLGRANKNYANSEN